MTRGDQYLDQRSENFSLTACRPAPHRSPLTLTTVTTITTTCSTWKHLQHFSVSTSVLAWNPNCLSLTLLLLLSPSFSSVDSMSALSVVKREVWRVGGGWGGGKKKEGTLGGGGERLEVSDGCGKLRLGFLHRNQLKTQTWSKNICPTDSCSQHVSIGVKMEITSCQSNTPTHRT